MSPPHTTRREWLWRCFVSTPMGVLSLFGIPDNIAAMNRWVSAAAQFVSQDTSRWALLVAALAILLWPKLRELVARPSRRADHNEKNDDSPAVATEAVADNTLERHRGVSLQLATSQLYEMANNVPVIGRDGAWLVRFGYSYIQHRLRFGSDERDWKSETKAQLRGLVKPELAKEYERCLRMKSPEVAAKNFISSLAMTLTANDLRD